MSEFVVNFSDAQGRDLKLDINQGYVYDQKGNQVDRWFPAESSTEEHTEQQMLADYAHDTHVVTMRAAIDSPRAAMRELRDAIKAAREGREQTVLMDLGQGDVHLPAALPNFAGGYRQFAPIADIAAPPVLTNNPADKYFIFSQNDAFQVAQPILGAPAAQPAEVPPRLANQTFSTTEYALGSFVPTQVDAAADAPLRIKQAALKRVLNNLMIRREQRVANLVSNQSNWNSNNVVTLGSGFQWDGGASSDPVKDIHTRMEQSLGEVTGIIMSEPLFHAFQRNPAVQKYFTFKNGAQALPDAEQMQAILQLPPIYVGRMKNFAPNGGAVTFIWGNSAILIRQPEQMPPTTQDDIATAYTFRWNAVAKANIPDKTAGMGFAASGGFVVREFFNQVRGTLGGSQLVCLHFDAEVMTSQYVGGVIGAAFQ